MDIEKLKEEVEIECYRARGPGGQRKNKKETAVKLTHIPTGVTVVAKDSRYQARNKELAFKRLIDKLTQLSKPKKPRIPTKVPKSLKEKILKEKKIKSKKKKLREKIKQEIDS